MDIEIKTDERYSTPKLIILTDRISEEIQALLAKLSENKPQILLGYREDAVTILDPHSVIRIYAASGKITALTEQGEYLLKHRLYEIEELLPKSTFVRISNSEIINLKKVHNFDLSFAGTICVKLLNGDRTYVSRRYVSKIKQVLGM